MGGYMKIIAIKILVLCLAITLFGCVGQTKKEGAPPQEIVDESPDVVEEAIEEVPKETVLFNQYVQLIDDQKSALEIDESFGEWEYVGSADGGVFLKDNSTGLIYGFDNNDFIGYNFPYALKGNEVCVAVSSKTGFFFPDTVWPDTAETVVPFLNKLIGGEFKSPKDEPQDEYGYDGDDIAYYYCFLPGHNIRVEIGESQWLVSPDSYLSITYQY